MYVDSSTRRRRRPWRDCNLIMMDRASLRRRRYRQRESRVVSVGRLCMRRPYSAAADRGPHQRLTGPRQPQCHHAYLHAAHEAGAVRRTTTKTVPSLAAINNDTRD